MAPARCHTVGPSLAPTLGLTIHIRCIWNMVDSLSALCATFVEQSLRSVNDGRPAARTWFATYGRNGESLNAAAIAVATAYGEGRVSFNAGSSFMNGLMAQAGWEAPDTFWSIYIAFEDFESKEDPGPEAAQHVAEALAAVQRSIASVKAQSGSGSQ